MIPSDVSARRAAAKAEAAAWLARLHADDRSPADERGFLAWLDQAPEHRAAFDQLTCAWEATGALRGTRHPGRAPAAASRRMALVGLAAVVTAGAVAVGRGAQAGAVYTTEPGEQMTVSLEDGSALTLDTATRLRVRFSERIRRIDLDRGRVNCRVVPDARRPFEVCAAEARVLAAHSDFSVRREGPAISVVALHGQVEVEREAGARRRRRTLVAGERLSAVAGAEAQVDRPKLAAVTAWRNGQAVFDDETLAAAAAEMNRYSRIKLAIADPNVGRMRLSGVYRLGANSDFARSVALLLPVAVSEEPGVIRLGRFEAR